MASFDRLRKRIDANLTDKDFQDVISKHPTVFRSATISGGLSGIAKLVPCVVRYGFETPDWACSGRQG